MAAKPNYSLRQVGETGTPDYKLYFLRDGSFISPFHDIPLWANKEQAIANMVVEIPRGTNAKLEINKGIAMNPIKQDVKDGKLRFVHDKYPFNYGALPQTWENPLLKHPDTNAFGDNDPIDACEIGSAVGTTGEVKQVKILGVWAMIDAGETDWKVLCIDVNDPVADKVNTIEDVETYFPGVIKQTFTFLRDYKIPDGKGPNAFAFDGQLKDRVFAVHVTEECHTEWHNVVTGKMPHEDKKYKIAVANTSLSGTSPYTISAEEAAKLVPGQ